MRTVAIVAFLTLFGGIAVAEEPEGAMALLKDETSLLDRLDSYIFESRKAEDAVAQAVTARIQCDKRVGEARNQLEKAKSRLLKTREALRDTLRIAATLSEFSSLPGQILSVGDPDQVRRGAMIKRLAEQQARELAELSKTSTAAEVAEFVAVIETANATAFEIAERQALERLDTEIKGRQALLHQMEADRALMKKRASELRQVEKEMLKSVEERLTTRSGPVDFDRKKGKLAWPLANSMVLVPFGDIVHPTFKTITPHPGLTLVHPGQPVRNVRAVAFGRVAWVGHMRGWGTTVVLDHASGWYTVYAGLGSVLVKTDAVVREGAVLGQVARPPGDNDVKLYFELRRGGKALNPLPYFLPAEASQ